MLVDELNLQVEAGRGGPGLVHFMRRKYQAFGGPDGGDGGPGGNILLRGKRDADDLAHLRSVKAQAAPGGPAGPKLMSGAIGRDYEVLVPLGTLAYDSETGEELGFVVSSADRVVLAKGGKGGKGNTHFTTPTIRAPKHAQEGEAGEAREVELRYRIFAETMLVEPPVLSEEVLVPLLLNRDPLETDYAVYCRKPRWIRCEHEFRQYDFAYLPLEAGSDGRSAVPFIHHLYWARHVFINLLPLGELAEESHASIRHELLSVALRCTDRVMFVADRLLGEHWALETETGRAEISYAVAGSQAEALALFSQQLCGTIVV